MAREKQQADSAHANRARAKSRFTAEKGVPRCGLPREQAGRKDGAATRPKKPSVHSRLPGDEPLEIFKVQLSLNDNRQLTLAYNESRDRMITIKTPTALLRLLNGRVKAFFEGRVINKHIQLERMLTDEESEGIAW